MEGGKSWWNCVHKVLKPLRRREAGNDMAFLSNVTHGLELGVETNGRTKNMIIAPG